MSGNIVSFSDATIKQSGKNVLTNVSIDVPEGSFVFLIGRTGSGKSSLIKTYTVIWNWPKAWEALGNLTSHDSKADRYLP